MRVVMRSGAGTGGRRMAAATAAVVGSHEELDAAVRRADEGGKLLLVRFTADWCPLCVHAKTEVEACQREFGAHAVTVDVGESTELSEELEIGKLPRVFVYSRGARVVDVVGRSEGAVTEACRKFVFASGVATEVDF